MPLRHHRTVDRVAAILEHVARAPRGLTLSEIADALGAARSSVQELLNGLLAVGYLVEEDRRYALGAGPFVLTLMSNPLAARGYRHERLVALQERVGGYMVFSVLVGDSIVYVDEVADDPEHVPLVTFVADRRTRRPILRTAAGRVILAALDARARDAVLRSLGPTDQEEVEGFLAALPEIRSSGLAFNLAGTLPGTYVVATALRDDDGGLLGAVSVVGGEDIADDLDAIGDRLRAAVQG